MKKVLLVALMAIGFGAKAQTVKYDTVVRYTYVSIRPVVVFPDTATRMRVMLVSANYDVMTPYAVVHYWLMDERSRIIADADVTLEKSDYEDWDANSILSTYLHTGNKIGVATK